MLNFNKDTPLIEAARKGDVEEVTKLIADGADVNAVNKEGKTARDWAYIRGHYETVNILDRAIYDLKDELLIAVKNGDVDTIVQLAAKGTDINSHTIGGHTSLVVAAEGGRIEIVQKLIDLGAREDAATIQCFDGGCSKGSQ